MKGKRVLVTGAGGFIGSHLTEVLVKSGASVKAFVRYNSAGSWGRLELLPKKLLDKIEIFAGDLRDPHGVKTAAEGCEIIFHLGALISIPFSYHSPGSYVETNIQGTLNILQAARELKVEKVVHTSTSEVYGTALSVPISEAHPLQPQSPYSASKIGADHLAMSFFNAFGTPVSIVRPFNTYGPRQSARAVIPTIISQTASGFEAVRLGSLSPTRDLNHVEDIVRGFVAAALSEKTVGRVINLGTGFEISIGDLAELIAKLMGRPVRVEADEVRFRPEASEVFRLCADSSLAGELIGWHPAQKGIKGLQQGLKRTIEWYCQPENISMLKPELYNI